MSNSHLSAAQISEAFIAACLTEVRALKPGNVHTYAAGHGMAVTDFETSARVSAPNISDAELRVGERIRRAVEATMAAVGCNTNLGILLLCAPLAVAAEKRGSGDGGFQSHLRDVLSHLDQSDTSNVFRAISAANPGGLGKVDGADVRSPPSANVSLLDAMRAASHRDLIAHEYVTGFDRVFALHAHEFKPRLAQGWSREDAISRVYLFVLARIPDTHIARKFGLEVAQSVERRARDFEAEHFGNPLARSSDGETRQQMLNFDTELKAKGLNPGSLADIMAAILFVSELELT